MSTFAPSAASPSIAHAPAGRRIGAWWRRVLAFLIDYLLIGSLLGALAFPFHDLLVRLGNWSRLIGLVIAVLYFARYNSRLGRGQSMGKRLLSLEVVDARGKPISFETAVFRSIVLALPFALNGIDLPTSAPILISWWLALLVGAVAFATFYLITFNGRTRQGLHDLVADTYVVEAGSPGPIHPRPIWKPHWAILGGCFLVFVMAFFVSEHLSRSPAYAHLIDDAQFVHSMDGVAGASMNVATRPQAQDGATRTVYIANVIWNGDVSGEKDFADQVADQLREHDPELARCDLVVRVERTYSLGFIFSSSTNGFDYPAGAPADAAPPGNPSPAQP